MKTTAHALRQVLADDGALHQALSRYTQEFLSQMLGVRRQTASDVARQL